jgi:protein gp37
MGAKSNIEWTDASWTPIRARNLKTGKVGWYCEHATTGCEFCYAEGLNKRLGTGLPFKPGHRKEVELFLDEKMLLAPLRWKKPRMIFVCSMTDLFADFVPDEWIDKVFAVMALCPQHTFQVLTKRADRMLKYFVGTERYRDVHPMEDRVARIAAAGGQMMEDGDNTRDYLLNIDWPLRNVWLGVSTERQQEADERIPLLLQTPAAIRFISAEPLLGPLDLTRIRAPADPHAPDEEWLFDALATGDYYEQRFTNSLSEVWFDSGDGPYRETKLDWVIVGGESGPGSRPMHPGWARSLRDQCRAAGVPFFFKQWGEWHPRREDETRDDIAEHCLAINGAISRGDVLAGGGDRPRWIAMERFGKKSAGRLLDGVIHDAMPEVVAR